MVERHVLCPNTKDCNAYDNRYSESKSKPQWIITASDDREVMYECEAIKRGSNTCVTIDMLNRLSTIEKLMREGKLAARE